LIENSQILENIGKTLNQKLKDDISKNYFEEFRIKFPNFFKQNYSKMHSLVTVTENNEIKKIGMSCLNDILNDNWALMLGQLLSGGFSIMLRDITNVQFQTPVYSNTNMFNKTTFNLGSQIQVGEGTLPATRTQFNINDPFPTVPENTRKNTGSGGWITGLGQVQVPMSFVAGGSGVISETCLFNLWVSDNGFSLKTFMVSRDNISPTVSFSIGQSINVDYSMVFN